jgi:hypothetical protein
MDNTQMGLLARIKDIEHKLEKRIKVTNTIEPQNTQAKTHEKKVIKPLAKAVPEDIKVAINSWGQLIDRFDGVGKAFIRDSKPYYIDDQWLYIVCVNEVSKKYLSQQEFISKINSELETINKKKFDIKIIDQDEYNMMTGQGNLASEQQVNSNNYEEITSKVNFDVKIL